MAIGIRKIVFVSSEITTIETTDNLIPSGEEKINVYFITNLQSDITINNPSGSPQEGNKILIRIRDDGSAKSIFWDTAYNSSVVYDLPNSTSPNKTLYLEFTYNSLTNTWDLKNMAEEYVGWLSGWQYRKKITIQGSSGAETDYQVLLRVGESSGSSNMDFHLEGHSLIFPSGKNDSGDIRFTADDGTTLLSFWVQKVEGTSPNRTAYIWVKVSTNLDTDQKIYCYYGNSSAANVSNGENTFMFFDDFDGTALDTTKWDGNTGEFSVSDSILTCGTNTKWIYTKCASITNGEIVSKTKIDSGARGSIWGRNNQTSNYANTDVKGYSMNYRYPNGDVRARKWNNGEYILDLDSYTHDTDWHIARLKFNGDNITFEYEKEDGTNVYSYTATDTDFSCGYIGIATDSIDSGYVYWDYIFIKKYTDPEPRFFQLKLKKLLNKGEYL